MNFNLDQLAAAATAPDTEEGTLDMPKAIMGALAGALVVGLIYGVVGRFVAEFSYLAILIGTASGLAAVRLGGKANRLMLAVDLITALSNWMQAGDDAVREHWGAHDAMVGTRRAFMVGGELVEGEVTALDPLGVIHVRTEGGGVAVPVERGVVAPVRDEARSSELTSTLKKLNDRFGDDLRQLAE